MIENSDFPVPDLFTRDTTLIDSIWAKRFGESGLFPDPKLMDLLRASGVWALEESVNSTITASQEGKVFRIDITKSRTSTYTTPCIRKPFRALDPIPFPVHPKYLKPKPKVPQFETKSPPV